MIRTRARALVDDVDSPRDRKGEAVGLHAAVEHVIDQQDRRLVAARVEDSRASRPVRLGIDEETKILERGIRLLRLEIDHGALLCVTCARDRKGFLELAEAEEKGDRELGGEGATEGVDRDLVE